MPAVPPAEENIRVALARIAGSEPFRNAPQLFAFLSFVVDKTLTGETREIKGYTIATQALGRDESFDPQADPIVRVEAGRLRRALDLYYAGPGASDAVRISIPRGGYVPSFDPRAPLTATAAVTAPVDPTEEPANAPPGNALESALAAGSVQAVPVQESVRRSWLFGAVIAALGASLLAAILVFGGVGNSAWIDNGNPAPQSGSKAAAEPVDGRPVVVVLPMASPATSVPGLSSDLLRSMVLDGIARFDEVAVIDQPSSQSRGAVDRYTLNMMISDTKPSATVAVRLTHEPSGKIVWARTFDPSNRADGTLSPEMDIARQIATSLGQPYGVLFADLRGRPTLDARTRCIVQAYDYWNSPTVAAHAAVRDCLESVTAGEPKAATAFANLSFFYLDEYRAGYNPRPDPLDRALAAARRAVEIAPESPRANQALMAALFVRGDVEPAMQLGRRALELNPYDSDIMADVGARFVQTGRYSEGADLIRKAAAANPADPPWYDFFLFLAAYMQQDIDGARMAAERIPPGDYVPGLIARAIMAAHIGDPARAGDLLVRLKEVQPEYARDPAAALARRRFIPDIHRRLLQGLEQAGLRS
jgi:TolB-like protein